MIPSSNTDRADIYALLRKEGSSLAELERKNGLADGTLRAALTYPRTPSNTIIAAFLGKSLHELWPTWFDANGQLTAPERTSPKRRRKTTRSRIVASSQKRAPKLSLTGRRA